MATCLQVPIVPTYLRSSSSSTNQKFGWRHNRNSNKRLNFRFSAAKISLPPVNPNDPFIRRLASFAKDNPILKPSSISEHAPFLDLFEPPSMMASPPAPATADASEGARIGIPGSNVRDDDDYDSRRRRRRSPPPDLASILLDERIVYLGMPMVPAVTELLMAEFFYLQFVDDTAPIYLYINSTGTMRDDNVVVADPYEGFAIYDTMMNIRNDVETYAVGACAGHACLLLAAGKKGRRCMFPHGRVEMKVPHVPASGLMQASDVFIHAKEATYHREQLIKLFAWHTEHTLEEVEKKLKTPLFMGAKEALEHNVVDKILWSLSGGKPKFRKPRSKETSASKEIAA